MPIQSGDIKIYESDTMDDTAQGGGAITGSVVVDGVSNNIFEDISTLDRVYGAVHMRKIFPSVSIQTQDKYFGAHAIISKLPGDEKLGINLFNTEDWFDRRDAAKSRVESYRAKGAIYAGFLWATQWQGGSVLTIFQNSTSPVPGIGDVLYLTNAAGNEFQYVKITTYEKVTQQFTDGSGLFYRDILTLGISQPLEYDFVGAEISRLDDITPDARIRTTVVANAAKYFSARPLSVLGNLGDVIVKVDTVYSQVIPSSLQELAILDAGMNNTTQTVIRAAHSDLSIATTITFSANSVFYIGAPVVPGTLSIPVTGGTITDQGGSLTIGGGSIGEIDYSSGEMNFAADSPTYSGSKTVTFWPGAAPSNVAGGTMLEVTAANRGLIWNSTLNPAPMPKSIQVSYQALGEWYTLYDNGVGGLIGEAGTGSGTVNYATGTVSLTAAALPDVNSAILFSWAKGARYSNRAVTPKPVEYTTFLTELPIHPSTLIVTWNDGVARTATADAVGILSGDATGQVNHNTGFVRIVPNVIPLNAQQFTADYDFGDQEVIEYIPSNKTTASGVATLSTGSTALTPGTVEVEWNVALDPATHTEECRYASSPVSKTIQAIDDGTGGLLIDGITPITGALVNYATGVITFDTTVQIDTKSSVSSQVDGESYSEAYIDYITP